jgi:hypothetical protein
MDNIYIANTTPIEREQRTGKVGSAEPEIW